MATLVLEMAHDEEKYFYPCPIWECKYGKHRKLWTVKRTPVRQLGHYMVFRLNGQEIVYDPTLPHEVDKLPRDAREVEAERASKAWHDEGHYFQV